MRKYLCGVETRHCQGSSVKLSAGLQATVSKAHASRGEAFKCKVNDLKRQGYKQVGNREFKEPEEKGGCVLVLRKKSKFGAELRPGKSGETGTAGASSRFMPPKPFTGGLVF